jgi:hypothetical protein
MILAFGGDNWINICLDRWVGKSASGRARSREHGAWEVYEEVFKRAGVISATCDDYRAGAMEDAEQQQTDQSEGIKIDSDVRTCCYCTKSVWEQAGIPSLSAYRLPFQFQQPLAFFVLLCTFALKSGLTVGGPGRLLLRLSGEEVRRRKGLERMDGDGQAGEFGVRRGWALHR